MPGRERAILTEKAGSCYHPQAFPLGVKNGSKGMSFLSIFVRQTMPSHTQSLEMIDPVDLDLDRKSLICVGESLIFLRCRFVSVLKSSRALERNWLVYIDGGTLRCFVSPVFQ